MYGSPAALYFIFSKNPISDISVNVFKNTSDLFQLSFI
nr:MAG TPA: hypothetical protein [Bacteriophage sp.]